MKSLFALGWLGLFAFLTGPARAQGPLAPPGAPAPTMKTLHQIEPGTPIDAVPFTISQPGSYHLTGNLHHSATGNAIVIAASDVTLDGRGFILTGNPSSGSLVAAVSTQKSVRIRHITIGSSGEDGVEVLGVRHAVIEQVHAFNNAGAGVRMSSGEILGLVTEDNGGPGVYMGNPVPGIGIVVKKHPNNLYSHRNGGGGVAIEGDMDVELSGVISENTGDGILWTTLNPGETPRLTLEDAVIEHNTGNGVLMVTVEPVAMDFSARRCRFDHNGAAGVDLHAPSVEGEVRAGFTDCTLVKNAQSGGKVKGGAIFRPSVGEWRTSHISDNGGEGLLLEGVAASMEDSQVRGNGLAGLKIGGKKHVKTGHVTLLKRTMFVNNGGSGVDIGSVEDDAECRVIVQDSWFNGNTGNGLHIETAHAGAMAGLSWYNSQASHNDLSGIAVIGSVGAGKGSVTIRGGDCDDSGTHGILIAHPEIDAGLITGVSASRNGGSGIVSAGQSLSIVGNVVSGNTAAGIRVEGDGHFLDDNRCVNNSVGIELAGNNNAVAKNVYGGPGTPFIDFTGTNPSAPIQDVTVGVNPLGNLIY